LKSYSKRTDKGSGAARGRFDDVEEGVTD